MLTKRYLSYDLRNTRSHSLHLYHLSTRIDVYCHSVQLPLIDQNIEQSPRMCKLFSTTIDLVKYRLCELETIQLNNNNSYVRDTPLEACTLFTNYQIKPIFPIVPALCLMLSEAYYAQNYPGIYNMSGLNQNPIGSPGYY